MRACGITVVLMIVGLPAARGQDAATPSTAVEPGDTAKQAPSRLRVVAAGSEPFVVSHPGQPVTGLSVAVWDRIADQLNREYDIESVESVSRAIELVASGEADLAIGPISITERRARVVDFTQPYFEGSVAILAPVKRSAFARIKPFLTMAFLGGLAILLVVLFVVGTLMWLAERRGNSEQFPRSWRRGLPEGLWMALVTMTTVGYGDRVPRTLAGRLITGGWMLVSLVITSSFIAFVATAVTLSQIDRPGISKLSELGGERVAVVAGTTSEGFARDAGARVFAAESLGEAVNSVVVGDSAAVLFDRPALRYYLNANRGLGVSLSEGSYHPTGYGIALPEGSPLREPIDVGILRLREAGVIERLSNRYLGP